ncbi:hypothetical protein RhiirA1_471089 [Rhizophagus irregularis]|uniref:Reverse transcriptase domain-containing protein n=1 Tax=Rhizophagus irregularis TaxID=588596 RepID=A0A2N0R4W0_9GLOM|nr:hypothetical protein RhiirA1_471089 [Rhizophagus irregularis]
MVGNNFAGLPDSSVNTPINVLDGIIKSHKLSHFMQELWILSQDISKAFNSIDLRMLRLAFNHLRGLNIKLPPAFCLDLIPTSSVPLVTLSSELVNSKKSTWLFSPLWCLLQLIDLFHQFVFTWMDLKRINLVPKTGKTSSWFTRFISIPNLISYLPAVNIPLIYPPQLLKLQDFTLAVTSSSNRSVLSPCHGCPLHDASIVDDPFQMRSVRFKLFHRTCLTFLPSYRCLQLFHKSSRIDSTCYSRVCIPELFLVNTFSNNFPAKVNVSSQLPNVLPDTDLDICIRMNHHIYIYAKRHFNSAPDDKIICEWLQRETTSFSPLMSFHGPMDLFLHKPLN